MHVIVVIFYTRLAVSNRMFSGCRLSAIVREERDQLVGRALP